MTGNTDVVLLIDTLGAGGAEMNFVNLANAFSQKGLKCKLVLCRALGPLEKYVDSRIEVVLLQGGKEVFFSIPKIVKFLRREKPKVLLSAFFQVNAAAIISKMLSGIECKVFISEHSIFSIANSKENIVSRRQHFFPLFARMLYRFADGIVAVSKAVQSDLAAVARIPARRINVINNPVRLAGEEELGGRTSKKVKGPPFHVVSCGRLKPVKDFYTLIEAFQRLTEHCDARLTILGDGSERASLEAFAYNCGIADIVHFLGYVEDPFPYYKRADLFVLSSKYEGFGNVIVEAMSCGLSVLSTDCPGGPREILVDGKYGTLVPVGDSRKMAAAIEHALHNPADPDQLIMRSKDFDIDLICSQYLRLFGFV